MSEGFDKVWTFLIEHLEANKGVKAYFEGF